MGCLTFISQSYGYFELRGYSSFTETSSQLSRTLSFMEVGVGTTIALGETLFIGGDLEYSSLVEIKDEEDNIGFYKAYKFYQILPTVGWAFSRYVLKVSIITFGRVELTTGSDVSQITYRRPQGQRLAVLRRVTENEKGGGWAFGSYYQLIKFRELTTSLSSGENSPNQVGRMWSLGLILAYIF